MGLQDFTGRTAGPGGTPLSFETTSYYDPQYGWVPRAQLANAQASNNPLDYLNPFGGTSKGGSNTGDPTQRGVGTVVGTLSNFVFPGLGFLTGPLARYVTNLIQHGVPKQQAIQIAQKQQAAAPATPVTPTPTAPSTPPSGGGWNPFGGLPQGFTESGRFGMGAPTFTGPGASAVNSAVAVLFTGLR
jgi:hypothetical protein